MRWLLLGVLMVCVGGVSANAREGGAVGVLPEVSLTIPPAPMLVLPAEVQGKEAGCQGGAGCQAQPSHPATVVKPKTASIAKTTSIVGMVAGKDEPGETSKAEPGAVMGPPMVVLPESTTTVHLSSSDLNRIVCSDGEVKEALTSDEKGMMIKITGKDVFLKFKVAKRSEGKLSYSTTPTEIYIVCGAHTYSMIAFPGRRPSQTIRLSSGKEGRIKINQTHFAGLPFEKRIMRAIKEVYTDDIPESYTVTYPNSVDESWQGLRVLLHRDIDVEGEGMRIREYRISLKQLKQGQEDQVVKLTEKMFLRKEFALNPIAISLDKHTLRGGEAVRLFVVEQRPDKPLGGAGMMLPTLEGGSLATATAPQQPQRPAVGPPRSGGMPPQAGKMPVTGGGK